MRGKYEKQFKIPSTPSMCDHDMLYECCGYVGPGFFGVVAVGEKSV